MRKNLRPGKPVRVFIADSSALECQLMVRALQQSGKPIKVVGCATESAEILKELGKNCPNVAIITLFPHLASRNSLNFRQGVKLHFRLSEGGSFPVLACAIFAETRYISSTILSRRCRFRAQPR